MRGILCFKRIFQRLIHGRDPPFNMWNLIVKFIICLSMDKFVNMFKLSLNSLVNFREFKKNYISWKDKILIYLIIQTIFLEGIWVPQENSPIIPFTQLVFMFFWDQGNNRRNQKPWDVWLKECDHATLHKDSYC